MPTPRRQTTAQKAAASKGAAAGASKAPATKKAPLKKVARKRGSKGQTVVKSKVADKAAADAKAAGAVGPGLHGARAAMRDSMILARRAQGVPWAQVAQEAGISPRQAMRVVEAAASMPLPTAMSPTKLINDLLLEYRGSISTYHAIAFETSEKAPAVSLGALKAADEIRARIIAVLADIGMFPSDLQQFRSDAEMERIVGELLDLAIGIKDGSKSSDDLEEWMSGLVAALPGSVTIGEAVEVADGSAGE